MKKQNAVVKKVFFVLAMVLVLSLFVACAGGVVETPEAPPPQIETPTPEPTPTPVQETPETPDAPDYDNNDNGLGEASDIDEPTADEPPTAGEGSTDIGRNRHTEIRTTGNRGTPSGINMTGRQLPGHDADEMRAHLQEVQEDINYAFADQLKGPDGAQLATFTYHTYQDGSHTLGWFTLDILSTGESFLVNSADFNTRRGNFSVQLAGNFASGLLLRLNPDELNDFVRNPSAFL